jgi:hypothetical protein
VPAAGIHTLIAIIQTIQCLAGHRVNAIDPTISASPQWRNKCKVMKCRVQLAPVWRGADGVDAMA